MRRRRGTEGHTLVHAGLGWGRRSVGALLLQLCLGGVAASQLCLSSVQAAHLGGCLLSAARAAFLPLGVMAARRWAHMNMVN